jgi:hypothetical protein
MKNNFSTIALVLGITILLIDIFFGEYMFGLNTPIMLFSLALLIFGLFKLRQDEKKNK